MLKNPYLNAVLGGLMAAIVVASPIVDDGVTASEVLSILGAFLSGTGLTAVRPAYRGRHVAGETSNP